MMYFMLLAYTYVPQFTAVVSVGFRKLDSHINQINKNEF